MPEALSYSDVRQNFAATMDRVCDEHEPIIITRQKAESVVLMSLADYSSIIETAYLLGSPGNARALRASLEEAASGKTRRVTLDELGRL